MKKLEQIYRVTNKELAEKLGINGKITFISDLGQTDIFKSIIIHVMEEQENE